MGPIPWTAIDRYAERHGYTGEGFARLAYMVRALDDAYLKHVNKDTPKPDG